MKVPKNLGMRQTTVIVSLFLLAFAFVISNCDTGVQTVASGEELFLSYCAICHGTDGTGGGPMTEHLKLPPADLTKIAARRAGNFNADQVYQIIDGRVPVAGHGTGDMPIWGNTLKESEKLKNEKQVRQSIDNLVEYLRSIQQ
ncbi:MAG: cytochrome c [Saprospiraceae bacterium]|nr:cytochrome c [Saprospiraceae bacterium]